MNAKPKMELNRCIFVQKRNSVNGALDDQSYLWQLTLLNPAILTELCIGGYLI